MFFDHEFADAVMSALVLSTVAVVWVVFTVRVIGLRAFSKMTAVDFVVTVAVGSLLAGAAQASGWPSFVQSLCAISALLSVQYVFARMRRGSDSFEARVQNTPVLLMRDGVFLPNALKHTRVTQGDVIAKLREANVLDLAEVRAVILEATGDISVLHGEKLQDRLIENVARIA